MTMLSMIERRPWLTLWTRLEAENCAVRHDARTDVSAYALACPRCRRVFNVTDEQPLRLRGERRAMADEVSAITIPGEVVCPFQCGARFSVRNGRVCWVDSQDHRVA